MRMEDKGGRHLEQVDTKPFEEQDAMIEANEPCVEQLMIEKEDGPWSFVVAIATFLSQVLGGGLIFTGGYFYTIFTDIFPGASSVTLSWMCNLPLTLYFLGCLFASILTNRYGYRTCGIVGGVLMCTGLSFCYIVNDIVSLFICYGLIAGLGCGLTYVPFTTATSQYFKKYRTMMLILTGSGTSIGMGIFSLILPLLEQYFDWRGMLLILGAISSHFCALACTLFPFCRNGKPSNSCKLLSIRLLKQKCLNLVFCSNLLSNLANALLLLHLPALILSYGFNKGIAIASLTIYAILNGSGKISFGIIGHFVKWDIYIVYTLSLLVSGVAICVIPVWVEKYWILATVAVMAFTYNVTSGQFAAIVRDLVGQEEFADGVGLGYIFKGIGTVLAGPIAGLLNRHTNTYTATIYASGSVLLAGCFLMVPVVRRSTEKMTNKRQPD